MNVNSITEGDPQSFTDFVTSKITGNLEEYNEKQAKLKSDIKEFYFKTSKTRVIIDGNYVRVDKKVQLMQLLEVLVVKNLIELTNYQAYK